MPTSCRSGRSARTASHCRVGIWPPTCSREKTTPRFAFITPNLCSDGHDDPCAGTNSTGGRAGGLTGADQFLQAWMPLILDSPAYKHGDTLVVITFDEADVDRSDPSYAASCCSEVTGPNTHAPGNAGLATDTAPGGGQIGALLLNSKYLVPGSTDTTGSYNHYSALRSYEDLLGLTTGGTDGEGHLGFAAATWPRPLRAGCVQQPCRREGVDARAMKGNKLQWPAGIAHDDA